MFHVGIDISKFKHDCFIATNAGDTVLSFTFNNDHEGFQTLKKELVALGDKTQIKIGLESTGHYGINLKSFLSKLGYTYLEFNPQLTNKFSKATSLRKTKTDKIDAKLISSMLGHFDYKTLHTSFYHENDLKELVRLRENYLESRSRELVRLTNILDKVFPEFKPFFNNILGKTPLYILKKFKTKEKIANLNNDHYDTLRKMSMGKLSYPRFSNLRHLAKVSVGISSKIYESLIPMIVDNYYHLTELINQLDEQITILYNDTDSLIHTIPGIGIITAASIYAEIGNINRFTNSGQIIAYAGLDVSVSQSGTQEHQGKIVKRGSSLLRKKLYNYALLSLRFIPQFHDYYHNKKTLGKHHKVVLTHICRKLIRIIFHIQINKTPFDLNKIK
ncbi:IS110 family RNA-guided transposase [Haploplasma axanthum]|uniref:Transposase IS116/IS110/IS902 family n=1 Tax=Haploplasma axanthum TaxID=29552 RepID=A0A449BC73_HAPAX|nr:IS110 family transposase [Haploplasma axanthum]VEU80035.1 Transposase IS116/IS110/IS902 family [Haploplasma axanthum]VEU81179.1 Transposase IS116/IS110/IS902 family [Haploplasma axanthum]VEU81263.1 Transposase IS116/IS110/IS902 family [Haploplasma axanthum]